MKYCHLVLAVLVLFWAATLAIQDYCKPGFKFDGKAEYQLDLSKLNRCVRSVVEHKGVSGLFQH